MNTTPIEFKFFGIEAEVMSRTFTIDELCNGRYDLGYNIKDAECMQLTSLRSIYDEPIYNHMIVRDESGVFRLVDMFDYNQMYFLSGIALRIVGNRFQHPDLLELCK